MKDNKSMLTMPGAVIVAGAIIAIAIIWTQGPKNAGSGSSTDAAKAIQGQLPQVTMAPLSSADHILGDPVAPIKFVEYSDPSCPYCQMFNPTMEQIISEYGPTGKVAWVYRQFPLDQPDANGDILHPNAGRQAQAFECAAALGGNTAFWAYEKTWFNTFPSDGAEEASDIDDQQIAATAKSAGLDAVPFNDCLSSGRFKTRVEQEYTDGINAGVDGTPYLVIITPSGSKIPLAGDQSYSTLKTTIDALLASGTAPSPADQSAPDTSVPTQDNSNQ